MSERDPKLVSEISSLSVGRLIDRCLEYTDQIATLQAQLDAVAAGEREMSERMRDVVADMMIAKRLQTQADQIAALQAQLDAVAALPDKWRNEAEHVWGIDRAEHALEHCAVDVEAALNPPGS